MADTLSDKTEINVQQLSHDDAPVGVSGEQVAETVETITEPVVSDDVPRETDAPEENAEIAASESVKEAQAAMLGFDPALHLVDENGNPRITKSGAYMRKRGPRKGGIGPKSEAGNDDLFSPPDVPRETTAAPRETAPVTPSAAATLTNNKAVAALLVTTVTSMAERVIGPEWKAEKDELKNLTEASKNYLDSIGGVEITPGVALCIAIAGYSLPRMAAPNTQTKLQRLGGWVSDRVTWLRGRFGI